MVESFGGFLREVQLSSKAFVKRAATSTAIAAFCSLALANTATAQTTVTLNQPGPVTDTTIRNGSYANTNFDGQVLITRAANDPEWQRRTLVKFDTANTIPAGSNIVSAYLTMTVKSGLGAAGHTRSVSAYRVTTGFLEAEATWYRRMGSSNWSAPGGDLGALYAQAPASNVPGYKVTFNVTNLVRQAVAGQLDTRWTRIALVDAGADAKESYREYYSAEDSDATRRPTLQVIYGSSPPPPPPPTSNTTLKVMQWNIQQGRANDGTNNLDRVVSWIVQANADLVSVNEIIKLSGNNQPQILCDKLRAQTGRNWTYYFQEITGFTTGIGEAVLSRLPMEATAEGVLSWGRSMALARVVVNGRTIDMMSTHLDANSSARRLQQVIELKAWAAGFPEQRIVAGDFNWYPGTTEINKMTETYHDSWAVAKSNGVAVSSPSNPDGNTRNTRIDYIFYSKGATALSVTNSTVMDARASGISDHRAVVTTFRVN
jgi:endonuclease/exonuclease/phosphatase family metal-dependent hydrolase